jgi:hypothetical protein
MSVNGLRNYLQARVPRCFYIRRAGALQENISTARLADVPSDHLAPSVDAELRKLFLQALSAAICILQDEPSALNRLG